MGATQQGMRLSGEFASLLPELAAPWQSLRPERPELVALNDDLARDLGFEPEWLRSEAGVRFLLGNEVPEGATPVAQLYAGHQFGYFAPRLGDGRALLLGEVEDAAGTLRDLHLKGSGPTPFARADGYAAIGPMLREYLMGEAMLALGVPTTRGLAVVATGLHVAREESLDPVPGAVLVRVASSHLRVGSFQYARWANDLDLLRRLADYAISRHYPSLQGERAPYLGLLRAVIDAQARLTASWMLIGFVHGVMNTDNMTISGETIDYGPCAFLDAYDPAAVFSSIDEVGRYGYGNQSRIALWNLTRFAESLLPLLAEETEEGAEDGTEEAKRLAMDALEGFTPAYDAAWLGGMRQKLGLGAVPESQLSDAQFVELVGPMLAELHAQRTDYTGFFRALAEAARGREAGLRGMYLLGAGAGAAGAAIGSAAAAETAAMPAGIPGGWFETWLGLGPDADAMDAVNPVYIPRNHLTDEALDAAADGDLAPFERLLDAVTRPFEVREGFERYAQPAPPGARRFVSYCGT